MSLKGYTLDAYLLAGMYPEPLIPNATAAKELPPAEEEPDKPLKALGENKANILLLIHNGEDAFLSDHLFGFLMQVLNACKISMPDVALVNLAHTPAKWDTLVREFQPKIAILFNALPEGMPAPDMKNRPFQHAACRLLYTDELDALEKDKALKIPFWTALREMFDV